MPIKRTAIEALTARVDKASSPAGCWLWTGWINRGGYGRVSYKNRRVSTHRLAYMTFVGPIPPGIHVCHHCDNRACINPLHLFLGDRTDNMRDCRAKNRHANAAKRKCPRGHPYDEVNTYRYAGRRHCKKCVKASSKRRHAASKSQHHNANPAG